MLTHFQPSDQLLQLSVLLLALFASPWAVAWDPAGNADASNGQSSLACASCHTVQAEQWRASHHGLAMQPATATNLLGNFATSISQTGLSATFTQPQQGPALVELREEGKAATKHEVLFAFGVDPLQQYLTKATSGRLQVLPFAWDSRSAAQGGQRWYSLFPPEEPPPTDRFHWQQPLQNWNGMCADCHATNLQRNYNPATRTFDTQYQEGNVGCLACHGPERGLAGRVSMDTCAACHSLRTPLTPGFGAGDAYRDHFRLGMLEPNLYHPDGQIKEEVYVWGSFLQSKMYAQGVTCGDCHNPHSLKLRREGNALCGQCHVPSLYTQATHHGHAPDSPGAQCVSCHMPATTYMGVDARRDHKFVVPRPHLAAALGVPNACADCHAEQGDAWSAAQLQKLHGVPEALSTHQRAVLDSQRWLQPGRAAPMSAPALSTLLADASLPEITRASVLTQQARLHPVGEAPVSVANLTRLAAGKSTQGLLSLAALEVAKTLPPAQRLRVAQPQLSASFRSQRIAAADALVGVPLPLEGQAEFAAAFGELQLAQAQTAWRGEGRMNMALTQLRLGNLAGAEEQYRQAIQIDPHFAPAYVNLADLYRQQQRSLEAAAFYPQALQAVPEDASLRYSYALHLVRAKQLEQALVQSRKALELAPKDPQMATAYLLILDSLGRTREGLLWLQANWTQYPPVGSLQQLALSLASKIQDPALLGWFRSAGAGG